MSKARVLRARTLLLLLPLLAGLALTGAAWAGSLDGTAVDWSVLSGGGAPAESISRTVVLNGTLGQTAIGPSSDARLGAGFWYGAGEGVYPIYLPLVVRKF